VSAPDVGVTAVTVADALFGPTMEVLTGKEALSRRIQVISRFVEARGHEAAVQLVLGVDPDYKEDSRGGTPLSTP
jgi:hypothetical protein